MTELFDSDLAPIVYRVDAEDAIVFVDEAWSAFARANGATSLAVGVVGRLLWDFIAGAETTTIWRDLMARARDGVPMTFSYRCDSPVRRRVLRMQIKPLAQRGVEFVSTPIRIEARETVAIASARHPTTEPIRACSWCRRFDVNGFVEIEEAIDRLGLLQQEGRMITHTICSDCATVIHEEILRTPVTALSRGSSEE